MRDPLVTVIIPVFNVESYISRCIKSVIYGKYGNLQVILVDDGSTDESGKICDKYAEKNGQIQVIHKKNGGVSSARNAGLDMARGEFIYFVDGDDMADKNMISRSLRVMKKYNLDMCCWGFTILKNGKNEIKYPISLGKTFRFDDEQKKLKFICRIFLRGKIRWEVWSRAYKREIIEKYGIRFNENIKIGEDLDFTLRYLLHSQKVSSVAEKLYFYRERETSTMGKFTREEQVLDTVKMSHYQMEKEMRFIPHEMSYAASPIATLGMTGDILKAEEQIVKLDEMREIIKTSGEWDFFERIASQANENKLKNAYGYVYGSMLYGFYSYMITGNKMDYIEKTRVYFAMRRVYISFRNIGRKLLRRSGDG